jgi:hypothetical protein
MQDIEPYYKWRSLYAPEADTISPFYGKVYNDSQCSNSIYNYYIHPRWDSIGSSTLYIKVLYTDYEAHYAILEMFGEWNDCLHNDIMFFKRQVIELMQKEGISKFILILDNVLNFHGSDDCYYEEWYEEVSDENGWIALVNTMDHIDDELHDTRLQFYMHFGKHLNNLNWRILQPHTFFKKVEDLVFNGRVGVLGS